VADMTGRPRNSISRAVHRMLRDGYLTRSPDPDDGRQALLRITPTGLELHKAIVAKFVGREAELLGVLSNTERRTLDHLLNKLVSNAIR
ncbi:MAG: MarR family winged helix-turn-helix transcriptional regulator, partial [Hyphomicrobiaceae bacterium]